MVANKQTHFATVILSIYLLIVPKISNSNIDCLPSTVFDKLETSIIDVTGDNLKSSTEYMLSHASSSDFILFDSATIKKESFVKALQKSKATIIVRTEKGKDAAKKLLGCPIQDLEVLAAIPEDAHGVSLMYQSDTGKISNVVEHYVKIATSFKKNPATKVLSKSQNSSTISSTLLKGAKSKEQNNKFLIIIGHNEDGILCLPDGSRIKVTELVNASSLSNRPILVLSCETLGSNINHYGFVTTRPLYFPEIVKAINTASDNHPKTVAEVIRIINESFVPAINNTYFAVSFNGEYLIIANIYSVSNSQSR